MEGAELRRYLEQRSDPDFVAKKKKYLNRWYKLNREKQLAYRRAERLKYPEKIKARRKKTRERRNSALRAMGLSRRGNLLLNEAETYMLEVWCGLESGNKLPKKQRILYAKKGAVAAIKNKKKRLQKALRKLGPKRLKQLQKLFRTQTQRPRSKPHQHQKEA